MVHQGSLECVAVITQATYGPHAIVLEHTPHCLTHMKMVELVLIFPRIRAHVLE